MKVGNAETGVGAYQCFKSVGVEEQIMIQEGGTGFGTKRTLVKIHLFHYPGWSPRSIKQRINASTDF